MANKDGTKLRIAIIHPDLGIGGAERLIVDAAMELASHGHNVHVFTSHHDKNRCFEETLSGVFPVTVYGNFLPRLNFLSINRFERKKNIDLAISAFARLLTIEGRNVRDVTLTVVGGYDKRLRENVEYLEELKLLAQREEIADRVKFITSCTTHERNTLLSQCLCVLYTSQHEHFGIVPLEAMAAYKPVIRCNSGGPTKTIKHEVTGFLCVPTPQEFSLAMSKLIQDPKLAERMGDEARHHVVESFSTQVFGQQLNQFILDAARIKCD